MYRSAGSLPKCGGSRHPALSHRAKALLSPIHAKNAPHESSSGPLFPNAVSRTPAIYELPIELLTPAPEVLCFFSRGLLDTRWTCRDGRRLR